MWEPGELFYEARLEIDRANKNIDMIHNNEFALVFTRCCATLAEDDPNSPDDLIWRLRVYKEIPDAFALLVGQTVLALRSSINIVSAIITKSYGKFPAAPNFEGLVSAVRGFEVKLRARIGEFETLDAHDGGKFRNLKSLFEINVGNDDRVKVTYRASAYRMHCDGVSVLDEAIVKPFRDREVILSSPKYFRGLHCKANDYVATSIEVAFDDGGPWQGKGVRSVLKMLADGAFSLVDALLPFTE